MKKILLILILSSALIMGASCVYAEDVHDDDVPWLLSVEPTIELTSK